MRTLAAMILLFSCGSTFAEDASAPVPPDWAQQPAWLANPSGHAKCSRGEGSVCFEVPDVGRGMKWLAELPGAVDLSKTPWVCVRYRAANLSSSADYCLSLGSSQAGAAFQTIVAAADLVCDGAWHVRIARAQPGSVTAAAVQVQALNAAATLEIARLSFHEDKPMIRPEDVMDSGKRAPGRFRSIDVSGLCDTDSSEIAPKLGFSGWIAEGSTSAYGIPFEVRKGLASLGQASQIPIPKSSRGSELFFLISAAGEPEGGGAIKPEPHLFSADVEYLSGPAMRAIPARMPSGFGLVPGLAVYAVALDPHHVLKSVRLNARVKGMAIGLVAAAIGTDTNVARHARVPALATARPYVPAKPASTGWSTKKSADGSSLTFAAGASGVTLRLNPVSIEVSHPDGRIAAGGSLWTVAVGAAELHSTDFTGQVERTGAGVTEFALRDNRKLGITGRLTVQADEPGLLQMRLRLAPERTGALKVAFPTLGSIRSTAGDALTYCFPQQSSVVSDVPVELNEWFSGAFPLQFMDVCGDEGGLALLTRDTKCVIRSFHLRKDAAQVLMQVDYPERQCSTAQPFESVQSVVVLHAGDWHTAMDLYTRWLRSWYKPDAPRKDWFRGVFNFRQQFLRFYIADGLYFDSKTGRFTFADGIERDKQLFGGVDYLHLLDWGASPTRGFLGDYVPWDSDFSLDGFREAVRKTQAAGIPVGLYIEGYLASPESAIGKAEAGRWEIIDVNGAAVHNYGPVLTFCPTIPGWQDHLADVYSRVKRETGAMGYYCDEVGFSFGHYNCYAHDHGHGVPVSQVLGEGEMMRKIRASLGPDSAFYTEYLPCDIQTQHLDGCFTKAVCFRSELYSASGINLARFALPDLKTFEIVTLDKPLGDDVTGLELIFFNGEGTWLAGPEKWYSPETLAFIRRSHALMKEYTDCFTSLNCVPLVPTGQPKVFANQFPGDSRTLWTLFNANFSTVAGELLAVRHVPGARYFDRWRNREIKPRVSDGIAYLALELGPRGVGCVVQVRK